MCEDGCVRMGVALVKNPVPPEGGKRQIATTFRMFVEGGILDRSDEI